MARGTSLLPLALLIILVAKACGSWDEFLHVAVGEPVYNPLVSRVRRQLERDFINVTDPDSNVTENATIVDDHNYYKVVYHQPQSSSSRFWINLADIPSTTVHPNLSSNPRLAVKINLKFPFPFYGHDVSNIFLTTGGFIYVGWHVHRYLAATQYIAPLMANFDPAESPNCTISYYTNTSHFIAQWTNIRLGDNPQGGVFTFQTMLKDNGEILFAYQDVPIPIVSIPGDVHPKKVGVADAFYIDRKLSFWFKKRTIYEYHKVAVNTSLVSSSSAVSLIPMPTCNLQTDCTSCTTTHVKFNCSWCQTAGRCSDGFDRHRQSWLESRCEEKGNHDEFPSQCGRHKVTLPPNALPTTMFPYKTTKPVVIARIDCSERDLIMCHNGGVCKDGKCLCPTKYTGRLCENYFDNKGKDQGGYQPQTGDGNGTKGGDSTGLALRIGTILGSIFIAILVLGLVGWIVYAYRNPNTNSGLFLIEIMRFRLRKNTAVENGVGYKYHKPDDEIDITI